MTAAPLLFALVTSFSQFIDELSVPRAPFDFDVTAQIALVSTNEPVSVEAIGEHSPGEWRALHLPVPPGDAVHLRSGDRVRLQGHYDLSKKEIPDPSPSPAFSVVRATSLGKEPFPAPSLTAGGEISIGMHLRRVISAKGVLASVIRDETSNCKFRLKFSCHV